MRSACCSCPVGLHGKLCKHQYAVFSTSEDALQNEPLLLDEEKYEIARVALSARVPDVSFYQPFLSTSFSVNNSIASTSSQETMEVLPPAFQSAETPMDIPTEATRGNLFESVITNMNELHIEFGSSQEGLSTLVKRLNKVQSQGQWEEVLNRAGSKIP
ncbi:hypothetical protein JTE90_001982 [Oedothorax gibbosus]|uniref:SWIM-type domain-containing protein n=1 Tax=Oedothorax gibbosus TaxID=931172 RepID=A0AAV6TYC2_9ARAC|nr:hypothetical protein JTE90_001982 [Oedothorax gibbosus]